MFGILSIEMDDDHNQTKTNLLKGWTNVYDEEEAEWLSFSFSEMKLQARRI